MKLHKLNGGKAKFGIAFSWLVGLESRIFSNTHRKENSSLHSLEAHQQWAQVQTNTGTLTSRSGLARKVLTTNAIPLCVWVRCGFAVGSLGVRCAFSMCIGHEPSIASYSGRLYVLDSILNSMLYVAGLYVGLSAAGLYVPLGRALCHPSAIVASGTVTHRAIHATIRLFAFTVHVTVRLPLAGYINARGTIFRHGRALPVHIRRKESVRPATESLNSRSQFACVSLLPTITRSGV